MSGHSHSHHVAQILGASTVAVGGAAILPETGLPVFASIMIATGALIATIIVFRVVRVLKAAKQ